MIDDLDESSSILRLLVADSLKRWTDNALLGLLSEQDAIVRTAAARELQMRGGVTYLRKFSIYLETRIPRLGRLQLSFLGKLEHLKCLLRMNRFRPCYRLQMMRMRGFDQPLLLHLDICAMKVCLSM